jgi:pimeloyl-ACP methyl ester carboxylesterase
MSAAHGPVETIDMEGLGGLRLRADVYGSLQGEPVLLLHGGGQTRHSWGATAALLGRLGWRAYAVDLRGHGDSEWAADGDYSIDAFAGDVVAVAAAVGDRPALIGASLGGVASLVAEGELGPVGRALVLVDVAPRVEPAGVERIGNFMRDRMVEGFADLDEAADAIARYNPHRPRPKDLSGLQKNLRRRRDGRWVWHWDPRFMQGGSAPGGSAPGGVATGGGAAAGAGPDTGSPDTGVPETRITEPDRLERAARRVDVPVLLVRGRQSDLLSEGGARAFLGLVPQAELVDVEGAGHMIAGDRNEVFNAGMLDFLRRHGGAGGE